MNNLAEVIVDRCISLSETFSRWFSIFDVVFLFLFYPRESAIDGGGTIFVADNFCVCIYFFVEYSFVRGNAFGEQLFLAIPA